MSVVNTLPTAGGLEKHTLKSDTGGLGFSTVERVDLAAAMVTATVPFGPWKKAGEATPLGWWLRVSPGTVGLRSGRQKAAEKLRAVVPDERRGVGAVESEPVTPLDPPDVEVRPVDAQEATLFEEVRCGRRIRGWSQKSRARMVRTLAEIDYEPMFSIPDTRPGMVTFTYPRDWVAVVPDQETCKRHLKAFYKRHLRAFGRPPVGIWKLEFQLRGAPHFHLFIAIPTTAVTWRVGRGRGSAERTGLFREWLSETWYDIVKSGDERHLRAGTGVDWAEGARGSDPKRLAVYFSAHGHAGRGSKEYQQQCPPEWEEGLTGRYWGVWGLQKCVREVQIDYEEAVKIRRAMRCAVHAQNRTVTKSRLWKLNGETGQVRYRRCRRRYKLRSLEGGSVTGSFLLVNDGPELAIAMGQMLDQLRSADNCPRRFEASRLAGV